MQDKLKKSFMEASDERMLKNRRKNSNKKSSDKVLVIAGLFFICLGLIGHYYSYKMKVDYESVPAVITKVGKSRGKDTRAYVAYTYNDVPYESALDYYNAFTMKKGREITVYIDPEYPDIPEVPMNGLSTFIALMGLVAFGVGMDTKE